MVAVRSLAESDVAAIREELSAAKPSTVWFTPIAVGVPVGGSAKVVSVGDVAEAEFIQVRPAGSRDVMFCSPSELTRTRPPRKRKPQPEAAEPAAESAAEPVAASNPALEKPAPRSAPLRSAAPPAMPTATGESSSPTTEVAAPPAPTARKSAERRPTSAEVTVTLFASAEGEWTVEVTVGKKRVVRSVPVQPAEVAKAARSLPAPVTEAIEASLTAARMRQTERVEQLRAELEEAQRALRELSG
jgi:hypothetical protein